MIHSYWLYTTCIQSAIHGIHAYTSSCSVRVVGIFVGNNKETLKDRMTAFDDKALLEGNLEAIANFLNSSHTNQVEYYNFNCLVFSCNQLFT